MSEAGGGENDGDRVWVILGLAPSQNRAGYNDHLAYVPRKENEDAYGKSYRFVAASCGHNTDADGWPIVQEYSRGWSTGDFARYMCPRCLDIHKHGVVDMEAVRAAARKIIEEELGPCIP